MRSEAALITPLRAANYPMCDRPHSVAQLFIYHHLKRVVKVLREMAACAKPRQHDCLCTNLKLYAEYKSQIPKKKP